jgi:hypothetical protein
MALKDAIRNPLFQYSLEIALPVIGYLFFDWSLPVIIAFYFFDYLGAELARQRRHYAVLKVNSAASKGLFYTGVAVSVIYFGLTVFVAFFFIFISSVGVQDGPYFQVISFLKSEGWLLLPLVVLASTLKDKMTFYLPKKYHDYNFDRLMKNYFIEISLMFVLIIAGLFTHVYLDEIKVDGIIQLGGFVVVKLVFDFLVVKNLNEKSKA